MEDTTSLWLFGKGNKRVEIHLSRVIEYNQCCMMHDSVKRQRVFTREYKSNLSRGYAISPLEFLVVIDSV